MATTTDTLIFEFKTQDDVSDVFKSINKDLSSIGDNAEKSFNRFSKAMNISLKGLMSTNLSEIFKFDFIEGLFISSFTGIISKVGGLLKSGFLSIFSEVGSIIKGALEALADQFTDAFKSSMDLEDALSGARRTANLTDEQFQSLMKSTRQLSSEQLKGAVSAEELAEVFEIAGQAGILSGKNFEESSKDAAIFAVEIAKTAKALDLSFGKTAESLGKIGSVFSDFDGTIGQLGNAFNVLADSTKAAATPMIEMTRRLAPLGASFKIPIGTIIGLSGALDELGIRPQQAATALEGVFQRMTRSTNEFAEVLGLDVNKLNELIKTDMTAALELMLSGFQKMASGPGGVQAVSQALYDLGLSGSGASKVILGLSGMGSRLVEEFINPATEGLKNMDSVNAEFINNISRVSELWGALGSIWTNTTASFTDAMLPAIKEFLKWVNDTAIAFGQWVTAQGIIETIETYLMALWKNALEPMLNSFVEWVKTSETLRTLFSETIPAAIENAIMSIADLAGKFETFFNHVLEGQGVVESLLQVFPEFEPIKQIIVDIGEAFQGIIQWINEAQTSVEGSRVSWTSVFTEAATLIKDLADAFSWVKEKLEQFNETVDFFSTLFIESINIAVDMINDDYAPAFVGVEEIIKSLVSWVKSLFDIDLSGWLDGVGNAIEAIRNKLLGVKDEMKEVGDGLGKNAKSLEEIEAAQKKLRDNKDVFREEKKAIDGATKAATDHNKAIQDTTKSIEDQGVKAYGQSVYPEMEQWVNLNESAVKMLNSSIGSGTQALSQMGNMANTVGSQVSSQMAQAANTISQSFPSTFGAMEGTRPSVSQIATQYRQPTTQATQETQATQTTTGMVSRPSTTVVNNFSGINSIDPSSQRRLVNTITRSQRTFSSRTVRS